MFGIKIGKRMITAPMIAVLLVIGIASAAYVSTYFEANGDIVLSGPFEGTSTEFNISANGIAGNTFNTTLVVVNAATNAIDANLSTTVIYTDGEEPENVTDSLTETKYYVNAEEIASPYGFPAGSTDLVVSITFAPYSAPGNYSVTVSGSPVFPTE